VKEIRSIINNELVIVKFCEKPTFALMFKEVDWTVNEVTIRTLSLNEMGSTKILI
jgi:hypothetical protein